MSTEARELPADYDAGVRFIFARHGVRGHLVRLGPSLGELLRPEYPAPVRRLLSELATIAALMGNSLKSSELMCQIEGGPDAPLKYALVNLRADLSFYGSAALREGRTVAGDLSFRDLTGPGGVMVITIFPPEGDPWQGVTALDQDDLSACAEEYFRNSVQLPTRLLLWVDADHTFGAGLELQIIPEIPDNLSSLEHLSVLGASMTLEELRDLPPIECIRRLYVHEEVSVFAPRPLSFRCQCSRERCENSLRSLAAPELEQIASEGGTTLTCGHCGRKFSFTGNEIRQLMHERYQ